MRQTTTTHRKGEDLERSLPSIKGSWQKVEKLEAHRVEGRVALELATSSGLDFERKHPSIPEKERIGIRSSSVVTCTD